MLELERAVNTRTTLLTKRDGHALKLFLALGVRKLRRLVSGERDLLVLVRLVVGVKMLEALILMCLDIDN